MPVEIVMPKLGLTMASGTIARWIKRPGEAVREGEPLVEVATDKIAYEVESPATGTLSRALGADGDEFACGDVIGTIALAGEMDTPVPAEPAPRGPEGTSTAPDAVTSDGSARIVEAPRISGAGNGVAPTAGSPAVLSQAAPSNGERVVASPAARRLARERGISLHGVRGTGPRGRITVSDVTSHRETTPARDNVTLTLSKGPPPQLPAARRAIYRKMTDVGVLPLAQVETVARVDTVKALIDRRRDFGWTAFAVYAVARLLREHTDLRTDTTTGAPFACIDVGVAADTPHGLIVPVVRDAGARSLVEIQREIVRLAGLARDGALTPDDVGGACFSISNVGPQGVERVAPLPDPPQTAILGIGAATQRPAIVDGALTAAWMLTCVVSFDHRFVDGAPAARFLGAFAAACADPGVLL
ncbi:MAG TPA: dihydrolipoamide acetyltransferase family protein [Candidatus Elarobacter sp.]|jgi:pyruvate dehydrogenase E2 component (dihydrolipoamide acetyltransferase)|nr:dihydrolipoamide acetyltransferase family protein [Candidatus Elarobacter sp.]